MNSAQSVSAGFEQPPPGIINTVAGNGTAGYSGDGGAATSAELHGPNAVAVDTAGNIYIADYYNNRIRKVTASTGDISTAAGNGTAGYSGDGGAATSAELNGPGDVAVDSAGNIYISDLGNNRVRKVTVSTGVISTVAGNGTKGYSGDGGAATSAEIGSDAVTVDTAGNIYLADTSNNRIRKVTVSTGIITTVAGNGTAGFSGDGGAATSAELNVPDGVVVDSAGNIYIADHNNERIRKVTVSTGKISTVAGNGTAGYAGDGGAATSAELNGPGGLALDSAGNIYFGDFGNNRIRKVTVSTGKISTVAGNGTAGYSGDGGAPDNAEINGPSGIALDSSGNIYIADFENNRIRFVGP
jgi:sugar lactone lactonase YvrE